MLLPVILRLLLVCLLTTCVAGHISSSSEQPHTLEEGGDASASDPAVSDHRFFLHEIFSKYGQNGQMTFEGFEHLLESLGLGNILIEDHDVMAHKKEADFVHLSHDHVKHKSELNGSTDGPVHHERPPSSLYENHSSVYHYKLGGETEEHFPELLVNISTLVDQHQEMDDAAPPSANILIEQCLSPKEILDAFGINQTSNLNPVAFLHLCPAIIYELDQGHCIFNEKLNSASKSIAFMDQWLYSSCAVLCISLCGLLCVAIIPLMQKWFYKTLLQFLVGLAIGSLSGDALLHLLPHALLDGGDSGHDHGASSRKDLAERAAVWKGFAALCGVFFFFLAERALGKYANYRRQKKLKNIRSKETVPSGHVGEKLSGYRKNSYTFDVTEKDILDNLNGVPSRKSSVGSLSGLELTEVVQTKIITPSDRSHGHSHGEEVPESVSAVAWMVIMGDGLHNFCDGLAIGTAFATGLEGGLSTAVAVFCHELPHELGDFAMLLRTGLSVRHALLYNVLSSVLCLVGMGIGVSLGNVHSATGWVFAATAGMFLYIALVDMLPELSAGEDEGSSSYQLAVQILGISCGVSIMLLIANYEQELKRIVS